MFSTDRWCGLSLTLAAACLVSASPSVSAAPKEGDGQSPFSLSVGAQVWIATLNGDGRVDAPGAPGTSVDFDETLGLDTERSIAVPWLEVGFGPHRILADYWTREYRGDRTLTETVTFNGRTFTVATDVSSEVKLETATAAYLYVFPVAAEPAKIEAGPLLGVRHLSFDGAIDSAAFSAGDDLQAVVPYAGGRARATILDTVELTAQVAGLAGNYADVKASMLEGRLEGVVRWPKFSVGAGYRAFFLRAEANQGDTDEIDVDLRIDGLYGTAAFHF